MRMSCGALASITYVSGGDKRYARERVEVFAMPLVSAIEKYVRMFPAVCEQARPQGVGRAPSVL